MTSSEEWKRAKEWIQSTNIIPMNGKAFEKSDDLFDFAQSLRDGVILCQVANKLKPGSVKEISTVTNIQLHTFLCLKNIRSFLGACRHIFKLEADKLFEAHDLYDVTDFHPVINTISLLSKTPEAVRTCKLKPFSPREEAEVNEVEKESIYGTLPEILEKKAAPDYYSYDHEESIYDHVGPTEEKIYDSLVSTTKSKEWFTEATDKRGHVINEILETEVRYLEALKTMIKTYIKELKGHMKSEEKEAIFMNTEKLYELHVNFNRELTTGKSSTKVKINLKVFTTYKERLLIYAHYCTNLPEAQRLVLEFSKDAAFRERVENCNRIADRKFPLQEQLVVPFQRILKYPLLLRDLNKHTPEGHAQKNDVMQAFDVVDDIARYINEYKRDAEMVKMIQQIENSVKLDTYSSLGKLSQYGRKIKDGDLQIKFITNDKKVVKRYAFLLEHCLLLCRVRGETYEVKEFYNLQKFKVEDIPPVGRGKFSQGWSLQSIKKDVVCEAKTCSMFAKTQAEKIVWVSDIAKCIEAVSLRDLHGKLGNHNFELATLEAPQNCSACQRLLRGQISQGYKCSSGCNTLLHKECLSNRPELCSTSISPSSSFRHHPTSSPNQQQLNDSRTRYTSSSTIQRPLSPDSQNISNLKAYPWYAGLMSRDGAAQLLSTHSDGSFLVRKSMNQPGLALSIRHKNETKHIKIAHLNNRYYLTDAVQFTSIVELINYYKGNSLGQSFPTLPTTLMKAVTQKGKRVMTAKYTWQARTEQELSFQVGQKITTTTDDTKWWYGECGGREGYFPSNYVE